MKIKKKDIILLATIFVIAGLVWLGLRLTRDEGASAVVTVDGEVYGTYPLNVDSEICIGDEEHYNILVIKDGKAMIRDASCPDKLCVKQGEKRYDTQSLVCLPNKLVVEIKGGEKSEIDAVVK